MSCHFRSLLAVCFGLIAVAVFTGISALAAGTVTQVSSRSGLAGNDIIDCSQLPAPYQQIPPSLSVSSKNGLPAVVTNFSTEPGTFYSTRQGNPWLGNFALGDFLIESDSSFEITFAEPVKGIGTQMGYDR